MESTIAGNIGDPDVLKVRHYKGTRAENRG